uniref:Uncharacterized protein n=1 Tax=Podoviridae sp. ct8Lf7 TaxID=2827723 RepID=A0A8S5S0Z3_9CAUD|nr:MAG TPA: hypothetical protein [Podoviridae sp. ct8Lf7]
MDFLTKDYQRTNSFVSPTTFYLSILLFPLLPTVSTFQLYLS